MRIKNSVVIVTGASAGIGRETALLLARRGAHVWAVARSKDKLDAVVEEAAAAGGGRGGSVTAFAGDVAVDEDRAALVDAVTAAHGRVDVLVNNAGLGWMGLVADMPAAQVRRLFEVNVLGLIDLTQRVLPGMIERGHGHIVNVSSIAGWVSVPPLSVYSSTKFAVVGFTDGLRRELVGKGITVALVNPGPINTGFSERAVKEDVGEIRDKSMGGFPSSVVAHAIARSIRLAHVPGYATMASPRIMGLARLGAVPGVALLLDLASIGARQLAPRRDRHTP